jgi:preprotein translocase subunit SecA
MIEDLAAGLIATAVEVDTPSIEWDWGALATGVAEQFGFRFNPPEEEREGLTGEDLEAMLAERAIQVYDEREASFGEPVMRHLEKVIMLQTIDQQWKDHLLSMDRLKEGIGLRGYAQQNPLQAYQKEGFELFGDMMNRIEAEVTKKLFTLQLVREEDVERMEEQQRHPKQVTLSHGAITEATPIAQKPTNSSGEKIGRNDPCHCGSGKKYKKCHGR